MELLRRYVWVVDLLGILIGAGLAGHTTANMIGELWPTEAAAPVRRCAPLPATPPVVDETVSEIVRPIEPGSGSNRHEISRALVDEFLRGGLKPPRSVIVPVTRDGRTIGLQVFGVDRDGPLAAMGLMEGDVVRALNGIPLANPDKALRAYKVLRNANHVTLLLERGGRRFPMDYDVRW